MLDLPTLNSLVEQRRVDPNFCPILPDSSSQAIYFIVCGYLMAREAHEANPAENSAEISFGIILKETELQLTDGSNDAEELHSRINSAFRTAVSRQKQRLNKSNPNVIFAFKAIGQGYSIQPYSPGHLAFVETYRYTYNPVVLDMIASVFDLFQTINEHNALLKGAK